MKIKCASYFEAIRQHIKYKNKPFPEKSTPVQIWWFDRSKKDFVRFTAIY